jgi:general secretion pathway protein G
MKKINVLHTSFKRIQAALARVGTSASNPQGFSLIEIMIVLAIMGMIAAFVSGRVGDQFAKSKVSSTKIQMRNVMAQLDTFRMTCNFYPLTDQTLTALVAAPTGRVCKDFPDSGFLGTKSVPKDGWGNDFVYESDGNRFTLTSLGADGLPDGQGNDADITSDNIDADKK